MTRKVSLNSILVQSCLSSNRDLNLDTSLNVDDNLLDNLGRGVKVDETLVNSGKIISDLFVVQKPPPKPRLTSSQRHPRSWNPHRKESCGWRCASSS